MELKDFVAGTHTQIIDGVKQAQEYAKDQGAAINPSGQAHDKGVRIVTNYITPDILQEVSFDVAVSTSEGGDLKAGIGIFVGGLGVGTQATSEDRSEELSRIQFKVPLLLPKQTK